MANTHTTLNDLFTGIANAIRSKNGSTQAIVADNFPTEIEAIKTGFDYNNQNVTAIPDYAFYGCEDLNSVDCYNLTSVGVSAFENCTNLKTVILYNVTDVGENAFKGCVNATICCVFESQPDTFHENWNPDGCEVVVFRPIKTWNESETVIVKLYGSNHTDMYALAITGSGRMKDRGTSESSVLWYSYRENISSAMICNGITHISNHAFREFVNLTSIIIPDSVVEIGNYSFENCTGLTSITIPDSVTTIGMCAFENCTNLASITIPDGVTDIGASAFDNTAYYNKTSNWENGVLYIGKHLIKAKTVLSDSYEIKNGTLHICEHAFDHCESLNSIVIPNSVVEINVAAFSYCKNLSSITYAGTIAQWGAINLERSWDYSLGDYTIHCTDGDIAKDGTITYYDTTT